MTKYDKIIGSLEDGVCKNIVDQQERRVKKLWEKAESEGKEVVMGFGIIDGKVEVSVPITGDTYEISKAKIQSSIDAALSYTKDQYTETGHMHTHPVETETMPNVMSPGDYNMHLNLMDWRKNYISSLILTKLEGDYILFGLESEGRRSDLAEIQQDLAKLRGDFQNHETLEKNPFEILAEMEDLMMDNFNSCSYRFR